MKEKRETFLKDVYEIQVIKGSRAAQINRVDGKEDEWRESLSIIDYWVEKGFLAKDAMALGFASIKLTAYGIDYVEENLI